MSKSTQVTEAYLAELEELTKYIRPTFCYFSPNDVRVLITALREARAEVEGARACNGKALTEMANLREQNSRYREALASLMADISRTVDVSIDWSGAVSTIVSGDALARARAALQGEKET
jgi:hypothetical protein